MLTTYQAPYDQYITKMRYGKIASFFFTPDPSSISLKAIRCLPGQAFLLNGQRPTEGHRILSAPNTCYHK
jgi:hypothetical protein